MHAAARRVVVAILALVVLAYVPFLGGGLLTDDFVHRARLDDLRSARELLTAPDAFGFYRPVTQASLALDTFLFHEDAEPVCRAINLALHALALAAAFAVARLVLPSTFGAAAAVVAFALTPKAHPIAVLWLSARGELLMAIFSLAAVAAWIRWSRGAGSRWLAAAAVCYALAVLSKEAAILLPVLLLVTPGATAPPGARARGALLLGLLGALIFWWRSGTGALMPFSVHEHYNLNVPLYRLGRNAENYIGRMLVVPLVLLAGAAIAVALTRDRTRPARAGTSRSRAGLAAFSTAWTLLFLAPVLGVVARSELYLYLPTFGLCLLAAAIAAPWLERVRLTRAAIAWLILCLAGLELYQVSRSAAIHEDLAFSERLVTALRDMPALQGHRGPIVIFGQDPQTRQFLQDALSGYVPFVAQRALGEAAFTETAPTVRLRCTYQDGHVRLTPAI